MPSAGSDSIPSPSARASPVTASTRLRSASSGNSTSNPPAAHTASSAPSQLSTTSTLNPNAGGFQPGALSALGEVEHEVLITPQVATFAAAGLTSPGRHRQQSQQQHAMPQSPHSQQQSQAQQAQAQAAAGMQHAGGPFTSSNSGNTGSTAPIGNPFGSPIQTPQSQIGNQHNPYSINMNTPEWQNFHNVFNKGIGVNNNGAGTPPSQTGSSNNNAGNQSPMNTNNPIDFASLLANMQQGAGAGLAGGNQGGFIDYNNPNAIAAALNGMQLNTQNPMQAQLLMLQQMQLQQQALQQQQQNTTPQQQAALALQQQQLQLQALMSAQNTLQQQSQVQPQGIAPRFNQSTSQPDLASLAAGLAANNGGMQGVGQNQFIAEQMALQAQYDQLRQQQQDLMNRFQEMQLHAAQLAQVQAQMSPQQLHTAGGGGSPGHHHAQQQQQQSQMSSPLSGNASHLHHAREASNAPSQGHAQPTAAAPTNTGAGAGGRPHRRGPSQSISGIGGIASSGPMGQFGSMGQFALPSSHSSSASVSIGGAGAGGLPKGHGRRHSVNVAANKRANENINNNINMAFSFPAGSNNPTQQQGGQNQQQGQAAGNGMMGQHQQQNNDIMEDGNENTGGVHGQARAARAYGHGRRESRGSIGSLAGWGSSESTLVF